MLDIATASRSEFLARIICRLLIRDGPENERGRGRGGRGWENGGGVGFNRRGVASYDRSDACSLWFIPLYFLPTAVMDPGTGAVLGTLCSGHYVRGCTYRRLRSGLYVQDITFRTQHSGL